jgi:hypothetical protein
MQIGIKNTNNRENNTACYFHPEPEKHPAIVKGKNKLKERYIA